MLQEEMRRVKEFLLSSQNEWERRAENTLEPGRRAYAFRQADIRERMRKFCIQKWQGLDELLASGPGGFYLNETPKFVY